jgi:CheY-like chemotaxis protein
MIPTILYIEDNPNNVLLVQRAIEVLGCRFLWAPNGAAGLEMAQALRPDLVLLDINLPDMSGYQVAQRLRATGNVHLSMIPIIVLTANALLAEADQFLAAGCTGYMSKPINTHELRTKVIAALSLPNDPATH